MNMETYRGQVKTPNDAIILFEACRLGNLPRVQRRLSEKERQTIGSGSVFVWDEREAGMRRWTDGKSWSASRVSGSFLTYREMEGRRGGSSAYNSPAVGTAISNAADPMDLGGDAPDGYRYKPDGLVKQSFSITTSAGQHLHLISYFARSHPDAARLPTPTTDPNLAHIRPEKGMYPEASVNEAPEKPAITRSPMSYSPFSPSPSHPHSNHYLRHAPPTTPGGYNWTQGPHTSPPANYPSFPFPTQNRLGPNTSSPMLQHGYPPTSAPPPGQTAFDRAPPPLRGSQVPPPPPPAPPQSYPQHQPPYNHQPFASTSHPLSHTHELPSRDMRLPERAPKSPFNPQIEHREHRSYAQGSPLGISASTATANNGENRRSPPLWYSDKPNGIKTEHDKRIPSINSLMNKSPPPHHLALARDSTQQRDNAAQFNNNQIDGAAGDRQLSGVKDLGAGKAFGEDSRALRKLDKAFAM